MIGNTAFRIIYGIVRAGMFFWHPVFRVVGRENIPGSGAYLICPNHSGMADPFWAMFALRPKKLPRSMAKKELMDVPVLSSLLKWLGVFGVDRDGADINAVKTGLKCLKSGQQLLIFPEGTRVRKGKNVKPKGGAVLLSYRTGAPILPMYISPRSHPFCPITCVIGEPVMPQFDTSRPREEDILRIADELMKKTYELRHRA